MKKQRAVTAEGQGEGGGQAPVPREVDPTGDGWDDDDRSFFARGAALEAGEAAPEADEAWSVGERDWRDVVTLPRAAVVSIGVILAGIWLLVG